MKIQSIPTRPHRGPKPGSLPRIGSGTTDGTRAARTTRGDRTEPALSGRRGLGLRNDVRAGVHPLGQGHDIAALETLYSTASIICLTSISPRPSKASPSRESSGPRVCVGSNGTPSSTMMTTSPSTSSRSTISMRCGSSSL